MIRAQENTILESHKFQDRAKMLASARHFFSERHITEVDCPILSTRAAVDAHIDLIPATYNGKQKIYLHSSPEYGMKRLLAEGSGDIYQLSHVFRDGEYGDKHNPEFMMAEWYRCGFTYEQMIEETCAFIQLFVGELPIKTLTYREALIKYAEIDCTTATDSDLEKLVPVHTGVQNRDDLLNIILNMKVEPHLGQNELTVITDYPATQSALAKTENEVAKRFEVYCKGLELANGYEELTDSAEQKKRFLEANRQREQMGKEPLPIDEAFLKILDFVPPCCGVAVGFDRLMMLRHGEARIGDVILFDWESA